MIKLPDGYRIFDEQWFQISEVQGLRYDTDDDGILQDTQSVLWPIDMHYLSLVELSRAGDLITLTFDRALSRISFSGDTIWSISPDEWLQYWPQGLKEAADGNIFLSFGGYKGQQPGNIILKLTPGGQVLSEFFIPLDHDQNGNDGSGPYPQIIPTNDGGCVADVLLKNGPLPTTSRLCRLGPDGILLWSFSFMSEEFSGAKTWTSNNNLIFERALYDSLIHSSRFTIWRLDASGTAAPLFNVDSMFSISSTYGIGLFVSCQNGDVVYSKSFQDSQGIYRHVLMRFSASGQLRWLEFPDIFNDQPFLPPYFKDGMELADGSLVFLGSWQGKSLLYKIRPDGTPTRITGTVASDQNVDCTVDAADVPIENAWIEISDGPFTYLHRSDSQGKYNAKVDTGNYTLRMHPPSYLWEACDSVLTVSLPDTGMLAVADFPLTALAECPLMTVDVVSPILRRCFSSTYYVNYCNNGSIPADSAVIVIDLDAGLDFESSSIPVQINGQQLSFYLGAVSPGHCGAFQFKVIPDCDSVQTGENKCVYAHIYPDSLCGDPPPGWSGATIEVTAVCLGDSVVFTIYNLGTGPMSNPLEYVIIDDHVIMRSGTYWLAAGDSMTISINPNGSPLRLIATQEAGHPLGQMPSIGIENCGSATPGLFTGFINAFPNQNGSTFEAILCREVVGSYDPNDKTALPTGFSTGHWIYPETELDYLIRFQNIGTDTAFRVIILDTLSERLDPLTLRGETASHAFRLKVNSSNALSFILDDIKLPPSKTNEAGSQGWVRFKIKPRPGLPEGALIENRADIYFDYNAPVITNTIFHRVGRRFWGIDAQKEEHVATHRLQIWPNPATDRIYFDLEAAVLQGMWYRIADQWGRILTVQSITGSNTSIPCSHLARGIYFLELRNERGWSAAGIFQRE